PLYPLSFPTRRSSDLSLLILFCAWRVVTAHNVVHAALFLVGAMAGVAGIFLVLGAEFLAWALVLVYIGAVLVLFLFGIMITRARSEEHTSELQSRENI